MSFTTPEYCDLLQSELAACIRAMLGAAPRDLRVEVFRNPRMLVYEVHARVRGHSVSMAVPDGVLSQHRARDYLLGSVLRSPKFSALIYTAVLPEQIAREVAGIERSIADGTCRVFFKNGHTCRVAGVQPLSEYDHASLLMIYNLPPL